jgi:uncharacterized membrane protein YeaQ/YmgE (transglycosylase-associated protein family)
MTSLIVQLVSGVIGGNLAGRILKDSSLGVLWNSVLGLVGGGLGGRILGVLSPSLESAAHSGNFSTGKYPCIDFRRCSRRRNFASKY